MRFLSASHISKPISNLLKKNIREKIAAKENLTAKRSNISEKCHKGSRSSNNLLMAADDSMWSVTVQCTWLSAC